MPRNVAAPPLEESPAFGLWPQILYICASVDPKLPFLVMPMGNINVPIGPPELNSVLVQEFVILDCEVKSPLPLICCGSVVQQIMSRNKSCCRACHPAGPQQVEAVEFGLR